MSSHEEAFDIRVKAAKFAKNRNTETHRDNKEEDEYKDANGNRNFIANYTKGLRHHPINHQDAGEVINPEYRKLLDAIKSEKPSDFENLVIGLGRRFTSPQAGFAYDLEGAANSDFSIRPAPRIDSAEAAGEMAEMYWMSLCRDISFDEYGTNSIISEAVADLSTNYSGYPQKNFSGSIIPVTKESIFRGYTDGDQKGPYISQFLYKPIGWGSQTLEQKQGVLKNIEYLTNYDKWLAAQNGDNIPPIDELEDDPTDPSGKKRRFIITGRDLARYVHVDALYQAYLGATLILLQGVQEGHYRFDPDLPLQGSRTQDGFATFGGPHILSLVTEVATRALKAVWYSKWSVHRRLRPEAFGGLIHRQKNETSPSPTPGLTSPTPSYPIHDEILNSAVLPKIFAAYNSYLLPIPIPEGSPTHPSYGSGHATVAGACVTILKAWFNESDPINNPQKPNANGTALEPAGVTLTVGDELNKVASNISVGRSWVGVHYRSDYEQSVLLGEKVALAILQEQAFCYHKDDPFKCSLTLFNKDKIRFEGERIIPV
jgi:hypothetical protein